MSTLPYIGMGALAYLLGKKYLGQHFAPKPSAPEPSALSQAGDWGKAQMKSMVDLVRDKLQQHSTRKELEGVTTSALLDDLLTGKKSISGSFPTENMMVGGGQAIGVPEFASRSSAEIKALQDAAQAQKMMEIALALKAGKNIQGIRVGDIISLGGQGFKPQTIRPEMLLKLRALFKHDPEIIEKLEGLFGRKQVATPEPEAAPAPQQVVEEPPAAEESPIPIQPFAIKADMLGRMREALKNNPRGSERLEALVEGR